MDRVNKLTAGTNETEYMLIGHPGKICKVDCLQLIMLSNFAKKLAMKTKSLVIIVKGGLSEEEHLKFVQKEIH